MGHGCHVCGSPNSCECRPEPFTAAWFNAQSHKEAIDHPKHYGGDTVYEAIKVIEAWGLDFCLGNAVKYISRAGKKAPSKLGEDLKKAAWYLNRAIEKAEREKAG